MDSYLVKIKRDKYEYDSHNRESVMEIGQYAIEDFLYEDLNPLLEQEEYKDLGKEVKIGTPILWSASLLITCPPEIAVKISAMPKVEACYQKE